MERGGKSERRARDVKRKRKIWEGRCTFSGVSVQALDNVVIAVDFVVGEFSVHFRRFVESLERI